jgi:hypothetical protein
MSIPIKINILKKFDKSIDQFITLIMRAIQHRFHQEDEGRQLEATGICFECELEVF